MPSRTPPDLATMRVSEIDVGGERCVVLSWPIEPVARAASKRTKLTAAERAVQALLLAGLSDADIAELRGTTRSTVTKQIDAVFRKLGVKSRRELIARSTPPQSSAGDRLAQSGPSRPRAERAPVRDLQGEHSTQSAGSSQRA